MSTDFSIKPAGAPVIQPASPAAQGAVATELPAAQIVTPVVASPRIRVDSGAAGADLSRQAFIDHAAGSVVYQVVDVKTAQVLEQFPDGAALRRRAYFRALDLTLGQPTRLIVTDRKA
jgi:hypothetical protein